MEEAGKKREREKGKQIEAMEGKWTGKAENKREKDDVEGKERGRRQAMEGRQKQGKPGTERGRKEERE